MMILKIAKGQDPEKLFGEYIEQNTPIIEDIIAVIRIGGCVMNELFLADTEDDHYFSWLNDWWEGEEDVALIDFFPVSEAIPMDNGDKVKEMSKGGENE